MTALWAVYLKPKALQVGGRRWDSRCHMGFVSSSVALYSSPFRMLAHMLEAARSSRHGCMFGGGV